MCFQGVHRTTPYHLSEYYVDHSGKPTFRRNMSPPALLATCFRADFVLDIFFDPEAGGSVFFRNVVCLSPNNRGQLLDMETYIRAAYKLWKERKLPGKGKKGRRKSERIEYGHGSHGSRTRKWQRGRWPGAIINDRPVEMGALLQYRLANWPSVVI
jgi:hypothetical protein